MKAVFITGTDTGCGKTSVAIALAESMLSAGLCVRVVKPVETGCEPRGEELVPLDARALAQAAHDPRPLERICPYRLRLPAAPSVAAQAEGIDIDPGKLEAAVRDAAQGADRVLVEGAGGLLVPICEKLDMAELALRLSLPLLVVARAALGTWNHTLLTLEAARSRGLRVLGVVISHTLPDLPASDRANLDQMLATLAVPLLAELPHGRGFDAAAQASLLDAIEQS